MKVNVYDPKTLKFLVDFEHTIGSGYPIPSNSTGIQRKSEEDIIFTGDDWIPDANKED